MVFGGAVAAGVAGAEVAVSVIVVVEIPFLAGSDRLVAAAAGRQAGCDGGGEVGAALPVRMT